MASGNFNTTLANLRTRYGNHVVTESSDSDEDGARGVAEVNAAILRAREELELNFASIASSIPATLRTDWTTTFAMYYLSKTRGQTPMPELLHEVDEIRTRYMTPEGIDYIRLVHQGPWEVDS